MCTDGHANVCPWLSKPVNMCVWLKVCVGGCVSAAGCDGMITLRPDGCVMHYAWETPVLFSACSRPHLKLKIHWDSGIKLFNIHTKRVKILLKTTIEFNNRICAFSHCQPQCTSHNSVHVPVTLISVGSEKFVKSPIYHQSCYIQKLSTKIRDWMLFYYQNDAVYIHKLNRTVLNVLLCTWTHYLNHSLYV